MNTKESLLVHLIDLKFRGDKDCYHRTLQPGLAIGVSFDNGGWTVMPLIDVPKMLEQNGRTIEDIVAKLAPSKHIHQGNNFNPPKFLDAIKQVNKYLRYIAQVYGIKF